MLSQKLPLLSLLGLASAAPLAQLGGPQPGYIDFPRSESVKFIAKQTKPGSGLSVNVTNYAVTATHIGAGQNANVLVPYSAASNTSGTRFFTNGTGSEFQSSTSRIAMPGGSSYLYGWEMLPQNEEASIAVTEVDIGATGTSGVWIAGWVGNGPALGYPYLQYNNFTGEDGGTQWMACNRTIYGYPQIALEWHNNAVETPEECADVTLVPQCAGNYTDGIDKPYLQPSPCVDDAVSIVVQGQ